MQTPLSLVSVLLLPAFLVAPAAANDGRQGPVPHPSMSGNAYIDCRCKALGQDFHLGERVCLSTPAGYRIAECRMVQNVTFWQFGDESCVVSQHSEPQAAFRGL